MPATAVGQVQAFPPNDLVVELATDRGTFSVARVNFSSRDSSLLIQLPYFGGTRAVLSKLHELKRDGSRRTYGFNRDRRDLIGPDELKGFKLSHHATTGLVDFNRHVDGETRVRGPGRQSFPLETGSGPVLQLHVFQPEALRPAKASRGSDLHLQFTFPGERIEGICLSLNWIMLDEVRARHLGKGSIGPIADAERLWTGETWPIAFVRPPADRPFHDRVLELSASAVEAPADDRMMIALAGFDPAGSPPRHPDDPAGACLGAMYLNEPVPAALTVAAAG